MKYYFSPSTTAFFRSDIHGYPGDDYCTLEGDAVEVSAELYEKMLDVRERGGRVVPGAGGIPKSAPPVALTEDERETKERVWRDAELQASDGVVTRHRDQLDVGSPTTLTAAQYGALQEYRARLRDWPEHKEFPDPSSRPIAPS